ncbi:phage tail sheath subtilisin-like domain-containing protein [Rhodococcus wratislaviensis]|uniref:Phage tail sheath protein n=1 Tax=Rhodococcus wratislaviensis NBRC 100605 TaxID=1219028 RepID=X0PXM3_RHOWR|nr:phage tail sheath subtilisin-like domain-containing protein [Rhodococcus wratislaviensis]GAF48254.1 hypothetical protein RW1_051_00180 [Rhodococcus wratislaviensis NBRC 100605]
MPEYLAPGVYVEEVDTGAKPIEGVSTSTCGMVGVTERGPVDVPVLVTSVGEYTRWFGGQLRAGDDYGAHRFLPHAIEGFFTNGGKRVYVVRTVDSSATKAAAALFDRGDGSLPIALLRAAGEGTGSAAAQPPLVLMPSTTISANDWVRIGEGSNAEYRQAQAAPGTDPEKVLVAVDLPLTRSHAAGEPIRDYIFTSGVDYEATEDIAAGDASIVIRSTPARIETLRADVATNLPPVCLHFGPTAAREFRVVREVTEITVVSGTQSTARIRLDSPLRFEYAAKATFSRVNFTNLDKTMSVTAATAGSALLFVDDRDSAFDDRTHLGVIGDGAAREVRRFGVLSSVGVTSALAAGFPAGTFVECVAPLGARSLKVAATMPTSMLKLKQGEAAGLALGQVIQVDPTGALQQVTIQSVDLKTDELTVTGLSASVAINKEVAPAPKSTTSATTGLTTVLALNDRMGLEVGTLLKVGSGATDQIVSVAALPARSGSAPDPGNVVVTPALTAPVPAGTQATVLRPVERVTGANRRASSIAIPTTVGNETLVVTDGDGFAPGDLLRVTFAGDVTFHWATGVDSPVTPELLTLKTALARSHPAGSPVVTRKPLVNVEALDAGSWGNRLRISVTDDAPGLASRTTLKPMVNPTTIRLASRSGVQPGTVLEFSDPATGQVLGDPVKVRAVDRATGNILLAGTGLAPAQQVVGTVVRSREFTVTVSLLRQRDPATPSRDGQVVDREVFRNLSLDPRHSNYIEKVIGSISGPVRKWDHRTEGASLYIRVFDLARAANGTFTADAESVRLGPETLVDRLPDGRQVPAMLQLEEVRGDDSIGSLTDDHYLGADDVDPEKRTGLQSLRNIEEVSLVAIPGRVSARLQQGVIDHCELMRYRFAVLDSRAEPTDTISDTQDQRQQFDTKYAALYYPWLAIPDPYPENLADVRDYAIPPTGHILGVFARTDIERGVHKAPANEVVRGITGLRRRVNKEQQDILNPYPVNINVIRDFRDNNRGIRVYGGRVITSDPDWKYVNVRRLLIFIEASIDRGLQWVVFEPNSEPLWARVSRVITNFLTVVWRNGALEGTSPEEAFFVRCDRTTMMQTDIDNGRLIVQVGVAPVKPAEFVIVRIGLWTARSDS